MKIFNSLIHWKKNIKRVPLNGYSLIFGPEYLSLHDVKIHLENLINNSENLNFYDVLKINKLKYHSNETFNEYYYHSAKENEPILGKMFEIVISERMDSKLGKILYGRIVFDSPEDRIEALILQMHIKSMIKYNPHYSAFENMNSPQSYKYTRGLKVYFSEMFKVNRVDLSDRPGRRQWKSDFFYSGGSDYWFGPNFFNLISKETLLHFDSCDIVEELDNSIVHIKLFDLIDYWKDENQARLAKLRKLLRIDEI